MVGIDRTFRHTNGTSFDPGNPVPVTMVGGSITIESVNMTGPATAADPVYTEGQAAQFSQDRSGNQRMRARALCQAAPGAGTEGAEIDLSMDLQRRLRMHDAVLGELTDGAWSGAGNATMMEMLRALYIRQRSPSGVFINRSGAIAVADTSQTAMALNAARAYLLVQNPTDAVENLYVEIGAAASRTAKTSIELLPGGHLEYAAPGFVPTGAVNVVALTVNHTYVAKEGT